MRLYGVYMCTLRTLQLPWNKERREIMSPENGKRLDVVNKVQSEKKFMFVGWMDGFA